MLLSTMSLAVAAAMVLAITRIKTNVETPPSDQKILYHLKCDYPKVDEFFHKECLKGLFKEGDN